jgi:alpha-amylase
MQGYDAPAASVDYSVFNPFNSADYFHTPCDITDYDNQTQVEECWLYTDAVSLPDVDTTNEEVKELWYDWVGDLVSNYSGKAPPLSS